MHLWGLGFPALWPLVAFLALRSWLSMEPVSPSVFLKRPSLPSSAFQPGGWGTQLLLATSSLVQVGKQAREGKDLPGTHSKSPGSSPAVLTRVSRCLAAEILKEACILPDWGCSALGSREVAEEGSVHSRENPDCRMRLLTGSQRACRQSRMGWNRKMLGCIWDGAGYQANS